MIKRFFSFCFLLFATIVLTAGLVSLFARYKLLSAEFYRDSFNDANFYSQAEVVINENAEALLKEQVEVNEDNQFGPKLSAKIIRTLMQGIELDEILKLFVETNAGNLTLWLKGDQELMIYFPRQALLDSYSENIGDERLIDDFIEISGFNQLPDCPIGSLPRNLDLANSDLDCKNHDLEAQIRTEIRNKLPTGSDNLFAGFLDSIAPNLREQTPINELSPEYDQNAEVQRFPEIVATSLYVSIGVIAVAVLLAFVAAWLSTAPALTFLKSFLYSGILMLVLSLVAKFVIQVAANFFLWNKIPLPTDEMSEQQIQSVIGLFKQLLDSALTNLLVFLMICGAVLIVAVFILILIFKFARIIKSPEDEEDVEEEVARDEVDQMKPVKKEKFEQELLKKVPE